MSKDDRKIDIHKYSDYLITTQRHLYIRLGWDEEGNMLYHRADISTKENVTYEAIEAEGITARANDITKEELF